MGVLRLGESHWHRVHDHLFAGEGEGFAFLLCRWRHSDAGPVLVVQETILIDPSDTRAEENGWSVTDQSLDGVVNRAAATGLALVEAHNHRVGPPRFSKTDRAGLWPFANYVLESFPDRPYGATVWANGEIHGEYFQNQALPGHGHGVIRSITAVGDRLRQLAASVETGIREPSQVFARQLALFGREGQDALGRLRIGIVGLGGTGSHAAQSLGFLGVRDFLLVDSDTVEVTNLNRLVTATPADTGSPKTVVTRRLIRSVAPEARVAMIGEPLAPSGVATDALAGVDVIFGCLDNDGPRLLLNRIAVEGGIPYLDVATGVEADGDGIVSAGGRVAITTPGGPCLACTDELDVEEVRAYFLTPEERSQQIARGYIHGSAEPAPSVVSLNGLVTHCAINELAMLVSGTRPPAARVDFDMKGDHPWGEALGPRLLPRRNVRRRNGCVECGTGSALEQPLAGEPKSVGEGGDDELLRDMHL